MKQTAIQFFCNLRPLLEQLVLSTVEEQQTPTSSEQGQQPWDYWAAQAWEGVKSR